MSVDVPSALAVHFAEQLHLGRRLFRKQVKRCQKKASEKVIHDLRIETRRLLALLELVGSLRLSEVEKVSHTLKKRLDDSSELRDVHVQLELLKPFWSNFPNAACLKKFLQRREEKLTHKFDRKISHSKFSGLNERLKAVEHCVKAASKRTSYATAPNVARASLAHAFETVVQLRAEVKADDAKSIHRMRIAFKRFRYLSELLQPFIPTVTESRIQQMKRYQTRAGEIQDAEVLLVCMARAVKQRKLSPTNLRELRQELIARKRRAMEAFMVRIDDVFAFRQLFDAAEPKRRRRK